MYERCNSLVVFYNVLATLKFKYDMMLYEIAVQSTETSSRALRAVTACTTTAYL